MMPFIFVEAAQAASPAQLEATTLSPLVITGQRKTRPPVDVTIKVAGDDTASGQFIAIWPAAAYQTRTDGYVTLRCLVDIYGLAERCEVSYESPQGKGFGAAALNLRTSFKLQPAIGPNGPIASTMSIGVPFKAPDTQLDMTAAGPGPGMKSEGTPIVTNLRGNAMPMKDVTMVNRPIWVTAPSFDAWAAAYPSQAGQVEGYAVAHCRVLRTGYLAECGIVRQIPEKLGFDQAAKDLAHRFQLSPDQATAHHRSPLWVDIPIRFPPPGARADNVVSAPIWATKIDPSLTPKLFPPEAAARGLTTGRGVAQCRVGSSGDLRDCTAQASLSDGPEFADTVAKLAPSLKLSLWSADGAPVIGGRVQVAVRLILKGDASD